MDERGEAVLSSPMPENSPETPPKGSGVRGVIDPHHTRQDVRRIERALREGWDVPQKILERAPEIMAGIMEGAESDRDRIAAARVLAVMTGQNQDNSHHQDRMKLDAAKFAVDAAQALASMGDADKRRLIEQAGLSHLLPPPLEQVSPQPLPDSVNPGQSNT